MIIQHKWNFSICMMMCFLLFIGACKKDKSEAPVLVFKIDSYYPNSGNAGTLVTVNGEGFSTDVNRYSASISGKSVEVISATSTALVIRMPEGGSTGKLSIKYEEKSFELGEYIYQDLSVKTVFPANGPAGSQIRIIGEGFSSTTAPATVFINDKSALVVSVSDTLLVVEVPLNAGFGPVMVKVNGKEAKGQNFSYQAIQNIKPLSGGKNTRVVINGAGFEELATGNIVDFNGTVAVVVEATKDRIVVMAPDGVKTGPLTVTVNGQKTTGPVFSVVAPPSIRVVTPLSGPKGAEMTIAGALFSKVVDENKVFINGVEVVVQSAAEDELKLLIPGGTGSGQIKLVVNDQSVVGPQFKDQTLGISSVSPDNGLTGTTVTIKGSGFSATAANNKVYFNGVLAAVKTATESSLVLDAPLGLSTGDLKVVVGTEEALAPQQFRRAGVMTLAGGPNSDVFGQYMAGIAVDNSGNVYVTDRMNKVVKKISPTGVVSTLKSNGTDISFDTPFGIVIDKQDNIYVSDIGLNRIRKITPAGVVTTHVSGFSPGLMALDDAGNIYANVNGLYAGMYKVNTGGGFSKINGPSWPAARPTVDAAGNLYYVDSGSSSNNAISRIIAGESNEVYWAGSADGGYVDAVGFSARFSSISGGLALYDNGKLIAGDRFNYAIREVDIATQKVSTLVKMGAGLGFVDGAFNEAKLNSMDDMVVDKDGNIYVLDAGSKAVRKLFLK